MTQKPNYISPKRIIIKWDKHIIFSSIHHKLHAMDPSCVHLITYYIKTMIYTLEVLEIAYLLNNCWKAHQIPTIILWLGKDARPLCVYVYQLDIVKLCCLAVASQSVQQRDWSSSTTMDEDPHPFEAQHIQSQQGFMQDQIIASHTCFGGHMDVNCYASLQTFECAWWPEMGYKHTWHHLHSLSRHS